MQQCKIDRRGFLQMFGVAVAVASLPLPACRGTVDVAYVKLPHKLIGTVSELATGTSKVFSYPEEAHMSMLAFVAKLGEPAGGGVGPDQDIVAFSSICTHQGGPVNFNAQHNVAGPCPLHLTSFDLTRFGQVVAGQATQALPQVMLQVEGDEIYAVGVLGVLYGMTGLT